MHRITFLGGLILMSTCTCLAADIQLWVDDSSGEIGMVNVATGAVTLVGNTGLGDNLTDIAFSPTGVLYGVTNSALYTISTTTGTATVVGFFNPPVPVVATTAGIVGPNALVFNNDGTLYTAAGGLYTIDSSTGMDSLVGPFGSDFVSAGDLAFVNGQLYLSDITDKLLAVNTSNGTATAIGNMGVSNVFGLASPDSHTLYGVAGDSVYTIDTASGTATLDVSWSPNSGLAQANGEAFVTEANVPSVSSPVPEPSNCLLTAAGLLALWCIRRRVSARGLIRRLI